MKLTKSKLREMIKEELDTKTYYEIRARKGNKISEAIVFYTDEDGRIRRFNTEG